MAIAAPEAAEALSPEASEAVSAAAAGRGRRLTPEVAKELRRGAARKPKAASQPRDSAPVARSSGGGRSSVAAAFNALPAAGNSKAAQVITRAILAFGAFLLALELASYLSGRYFTWSTTKGAQSAATAAKVLDLYPGQTAKLMSANLPVSNGQATAVVGTRLV